MLSRKVTTVYLLVSSVVLLASINAQEPVLTSARFLSSDGPVEIQRRAQGQAGLVKIIYGANDELLAGDVIKTRRGGRLVLEVSDGSQAVISENTTVEITDLSQSPRTIFNLLRGKTRIKIEKVGGRPNPYRVNTPTAVIAVRGTLFDVFVTEKETQVFVHEGQVAVSNSTAPETSIILSPGDRTRVQQAQPPESPSQFKPGRNNDTFKPPSAPDGGQKGGSPGGKEAHGPAPAGQPQRGQQSGQQPSEEEQSGQQQPGQQQFGQQQRERQQRGQQQPGQQQPGQQRPGNGPPSGGPPPGPRRPPVGV